MKGIMRRQNNVFEDLFHSAVVILLLGSIALFPGCQGGRSGPDKSSTGKSEPEQPGNTLTFTRNFGFTTNNEFPVRIKSIPGNGSNTKLVVKLGTISGITALAGSATDNQNPVDGTGTDAVFWGGGHLALDNYFNIIVSDRGSLRKVTQEGVVTTLSAHQANFEGIAIDSVGNIFGISRSFHNISIAPSMWSASIIEYNTSGKLVSFASNWETSSSNPSIGNGGLAIDSFGNLFLADIVNNRIVKFDVAGIMSVFAGSGTCGSSDGVGTSATFNRPSDLAIDKSSNLFVNDTGNSMIRKITTDGTVSTITKLPHLLSPIAVDSSGNIYVVGFPSTIIRIDIQGSVTAYPVPQIHDFITALVADYYGNLYAGTRGRGAQIFKISL